MSGRILFDRDFSGVLLHMSDSVELQNTTSHIELPPSLGLSIVLAGQVHFSVEGKRYCIGANGAPQCFALNLTKPGKLERHLLRDNAVKKVNISVDTHWLESQLDPRSTLDQTLLDFSSRHLALCEFAATLTLQALAEKLLDGSSQGQSRVGFTSQLNRESLTLGFAAEALQTLARHLDSDKGETEAEIDSTKANVLHDKLISRTKAVKAKKFIETVVLTDKSTSPPSLSVMAKHLGMSASQLQRLFKRYYGQTVFDFIRQRRLENAREKLLNTDASIGEVAYLAGYNHATNFTLAFKRSFGVSPGALRLGKSLG